LVFIFLSLNKIKTYFIVTSGKYGGVDDGDDDDDDDDDDEEEEEDDDDNDDDDDVLLVKCFNLYAIVAY
jgi:hypothetical protein